MLGDQIQESRGKRIVRRVLPAEGAFKVEVTFESAGKLLGFDANEFGTYVSSPRADGTLFGEGQGVVQTKDGDIASWKGSGVGKFVGAGSVSYRGAIYYSSASPKLARLNSVAAVFEFESDAAGNTHSKTWEWK